MRPEASPTIPTAAIAVADSRTSSGSTDPSAVQDRTIVGIDRARNTTIQVTTTASEPSASQPLRATRAESRSTSPLNLTMAAIPTSDGPPTNVTKVAAVSVVVDMGC
jgi:hypothetical protein